jgi:hypothetical protein
MLYKNKHKVVTAKYFYKKLWMVANRGTVQRKRGSTKLIGLTAAHNAAGVDII